MRLLPILTAASVAVFAVASAANAQMNDQDNMGHGMSNQGMSNHSMSDHMRSSKMHKHSMMHKRMHSKMDDQHM